jgi:hypothetical protein
VKTRTLKRWGKAYKASNDNALNVSSHIPVSMNIKLSCPNEESNSDHKKVAMKPRFKWNEADQSAFAEKISESLSNAQNDSQDECDITTFINALEEAALHAVPHTVPKTTSTCKKRPCKWSGTLTTQAKICKDTYNNWKGSGKSNAGEEFEKHKEEKKKFRYIQRKEAANERLTLYEGISKAAHEDQNIMHKLIRKQRATTDKGTLLEIDGILTSCKSKQRDAWAKYYFDLATPKEEDRMTAMREHIRLIAAVDNTKVNVTKENLTKAIKNLNKGKAADKEGLAAEHLQLALGSDNAVAFLLSIMKEIFDKRIAPDIIKPAFKLPIPKAKKVAIYQDNYRGISIPLILMKLMEMVVKILDEDNISHNQVDLQFGFTKGRSPYMATLLITEALAEARDTKREVYVCSLDARKAFDVVQHATLLFKLFHTNISHATWATIDSIYTDVQECIRWHGDSDTYMVRQGVKQGGLLSTILYKLYGNDNPETVTSSDLGFKVGNLNIGMPIVADDTALISDEPHELQTMMNFCVLHANMNYYELHPVKSIVARLRSEIANKDMVFSWNLGDRPAKVKREIEHLGLNWREEKLAPDVDARISSARRAAFAVLGIGVHDDGLDPKAACHIASILITMRLVTGLNAVILEKADIQKLDKFYHTLHRQIQGIPENAARIATYILSGALPLQAKMDLGILEMFGAIARMDPEHLIWKLAFRQLATKDDSSMSWFVYALHAAQRYGIDAFGMMLQPTSKPKWKRLCKEKVYECTFKELTQSADGMKTLKWLIIPTYRNASYTTHPIWQTCRGSVWQATKARIRARLLIGRYGLNKSRAKYRRIKPTCPICLEEEEEEDETHFIAICQKTRAIVDGLIIKLKDLYKMEHKPMPDTVLEITSAVLNGHMYLTHTDILNEGICEDDFAVKLESKKWEEANRLANSIIYKLHLEREKAIAIETDACIECSLQVMDEDQALSCDQCTRWQHIICENIASEEQYESFLNSRATISWVCRPCQKNTSLTSQ